MPFSKCNRIQVILNLKTLLHWDHLFSINYLPGGHTVGRCIDKATAEAKRSMHPFNAMLIVFVFSPCPITHRCCIIIYSET